MNHADDVRTKERRAYAVPHVLETRMALYRFFIGSSRTGEVIRHFEGFDGMRVLDLGCGNGELAHEMLQTFPHAHIVGIDTSEPLLEQARIRCVNQSAEFIVNDASSVTLDGLFDRILLAHTLHLMADKPAMLAHALRHVTSGGRCVLTLHSSQDVPRKRGWIAWFEQMFHKKYCGSRESLTIESWDEVMGDEFLPVWRSVCSCARPRLHVGEGRVEPRWTRTRVRIGLA